MLLKSPSSALYINNFFHCLHSEIKLKSRPRKQILHKIWIPVVNSERLISYQMNREYLRFFIIILSVLFTAHCAFWNCGSWIIYEWFYHVTGAYINTTMHHHMTRLYCKHREIPPRIFCELKIGLRIKLRQ